MSSWSSLEAAPPALWCHFAHLRSILQRSSETSGRLHEVEYEDATLVLLNEQGNVSSFEFSGQVLYTYDRDLGAGVVWEHRRGLMTAYKADGSVAFASFPDKRFRDDPLAVMLELPAPPFPERN